MKPVLNFDMDGTLADLYSNPSWRALLDSEDTLPYEGATPLVDPKEALMVMGAMKAAGYKFCIVSWGSQTGSQDFLYRTREVKRKWINKYFPNIFSQYYITDYGIPKHQIVKAAGNYLFDDSVLIGNQWEAAGGIWINAKETDLITELKKVAAIQWLLLKLFTCIRLYK